MASLDDLTNDVLEILYGIPQFERPVEDTIATAAVADDADVEWRFATPALWKRGDYAEPIDGTELVLITEDHPAAADVTVRRGQRGTTAVVAGFSIGDVFQKNPIFPRSLVQRFINEVIDNELWPHVWTRVERTLTWDTAARSYELAVTDDDVERVYQHDLSAVEGIYEFHTGWWSVEPVHTDVASTSGRVLRLAKALDSSETVYYTAKMKPRSNLVTGIGDQLLPIIVWGAAAKCVAARYQPSRYDPTRDDASDLAKGSTRQVVQQYRAEFFNMRAEEKRRLRKELRPRTRYQPRNRRRW